MAKRILLLVALACVAIQTIRPARNLSSASPTPEDFIVRYAPPPAVADVLRSACFDCHSNNTRYPWYADIEPVGWWLASHVNEGKRELDFSRFGSYSLKLQARKLNAISDQITNRDMPLPSYTWIHRAARLSDAQIDAVSAWIDDLHDKIAPDN